jgi:hypothetical protein
MPIELKIRKKMPQSFSLDQLKEVVFAVPFEDRVEIRTTSRDLTVFLLDEVTEMLKAKYGCQFKVVRGVGDEPDSDGNYVLLFYVIYRGHEGKLSRPWTTY